MMRFVSKVYRFELNRFGFLRPTRRSFFTLISVFSKRPTFFPGISPESSFMPILRRDQAGSPLRCFDMLLAYLLAASFLFLGCALPFGLSMSSEIFAATPSPTFLFLRVNLLPPEPSLPLFLPLFPFLYADFFLSLPHLQRLFCRKNTSSLFPF